MRRIRARTCAEEQARAREQLSAVPATAELSIFHNHRITEYTEIRNETRRAMLGGRSVATVTGSI
jgi:hypothetical protein